MRTQLHRVATRRPISCPELVGTCPQSARSRASRHKTPTLRRSHARLSRPGRGIGHSKRLDNGTDMPVVVPSTRNQLHRPPSTTAPRAEVKGARVAAFVSCIPLMQPGCQGNRSLRCGRQNGHAPSTSNRPPTTMNTSVWIVLRGQTLYSAAFSGRRFRDPSQVQNAAVEPKMEKTHSYSLTPSKSPELQGYLWCITAGRQRPEPTCRACDGKRSSRRASGPQSARHRRPGRLPPNVRH